MLRAGSWGEVVLSYLLLVHLIFAKLILYIVDIDLLIYLYLFIDYLSNNNDRIAVFFIT